MNLRATQNPHHKHLEAAIELAWSSRGRGDHPFGAVIILPGGTIVTAGNTVVTDRDVTRHAEMNVITTALRLGLDLGASTLYASTEPCAMCSGAIFWAGIRHVVYGCSVERLRTYASGSFVIPCRELLCRGREPTEVVGPLLEDVAAAAHAGFWRPPSLQS